jgi:asparagine synthase (glutamine-hydrolysing)
MFAGLLPFDIHRPADSLVPEGVLRRLQAQSPGTARRVGNGLWLPGHSLQPAIPRADTQWHVDPADGTLVAFWGRLDNREALAARWGEGPLWSEATDASRIAAGWRHEGERLVEFLVGEFAFTVFCPVTRRLLLARDPLGVRPISYRVTSDGIWVGSSLPLVRALVRDPPAPDTDWIRRYLSQHSWHATRTAFVDIQRLAPGHTLTIEGSQPPVLRRWFAWRNDAPAAARRDPHWVDLYRARLEEAVRCRWDGDAMLASESSAGIDSAAVTAVLAGQVPDSSRRMMSVGIAMFDDEARDILGLSRSLGLRHNHVLTRQDAHADVGEIRNSLAIIGHPEENGIGSAMTPLHEICRQLGVRHLFSGFGGDEAVSHPGHQLRRELVDRRRFAALFDTMPGTLPVRALRVARAAWTGLPSNQRPLFEWLRGPPETTSLASLATRLVAHADTENAGLPAEFAERARLAQGWRTINSAVIESGLGSPHVASRTESCTLIAATRGLEYHWPLLDVRLIQQYLSTPAIEKMGPLGVGRYLHRRAIDGLVPARITWRVKKDTGQQANLADMGKAAQRSAGERAQRLQASLHPQLAELISLPQLDACKRRALAGSLPPLEAIVMQRLMRSLEWVDIWLAGIDDGSLYPR